MLLFLWRILCVLFSLVFFLWLVLVQKFNSIIMLLFFFVWTIVLKAHASSQHAQWENEVLHFIVTILRTSTKIRKHMVPQLACAKHLFYCTPFVRSSSKKKPMGIFFQMKIFNREYVNVANFSCIYFDFFFKTTWSVKVYVKIYIKKDACLDRWIY